MHRMKLEFPADNKRLGKILYALAHCSVSPEFTIEYTVADPGKSKNELLGAAVKDSQAKASVLAEAAGVNLGKIINIDYSWGDVADGIFCLLQMNCLRIVYRLTGEVLLINVRKSSL